MPANSTLAASITKAASKQTYFTIRMLVDRDLVDDAYRSYAYFRWLDDQIDLVAGSKSERIAFTQRQESLLEACYHRKLPFEVSLEEQMLVELIQNDREDNSGLQIYLQNMMKVMAFDADRHGRLISQDELSQYTYNLASAVTEAIHFFIGNASYSPRDETRYLAVTGAHITHMLRDAMEDTQAGYINIPVEYLQANHMDPNDVHSQAYRTWVRKRVQLARKYFNAGRIYTAKVKNIRCRLAGYAYTRRFEWLLDVIEKEDFYLRPAYQDRKTFSAGFNIVWQTLWSMILLPGARIHPRSETARSRLIREP